MKTVDECLNELDELKVYMNYIIEICCNKYCQYPTVRKTLPSIEETHTGRLPSFKDYLEVKGTKYDFTRRLYTSHVVVIEGKIHDSVVKIDIPKRYGGYKYALWKGTPFNFEYYTIKL